MFIKEHQLKTFSDATYWNTSKAAALTSQKQSSSPARQKRCSEDFWKIPREILDVESYFLVKFKADCSEQLFHTKLTSPSVFSTRFSKCFQSY